MRDLKLFRDSKDCCACFRALLSCSQHHCTQSKFDSDSGTVATNSAVKVLNLKLNLIVLQGDSKLEKGVTEDFLNFHFSSHQKFEMYLPSFDK